MKDVRSTSFINCSFFSYNFNGSDRGNGETQCANISSTRGRRSRSNVSEVLAWWSS